MLQMLFRLEHGRARDCYRGIRERSTVGMLRLRIVPATFHSRVCDARISDTCAPFYIADTIIFARCSFALIQILQEVSNIVHG